MCPVESVRSFCARSVRVIPVSLPREMLLAEEEDNGTRLFKADLLQCKNQDADSVFKVGIFVVVAVCFLLLYALVFFLNVYCRVLPDVLSLMFFHAPRGFLQ